MIITVSREPDAHTWTVTPTNDDGSKIVRDTGDNHHNDVPWRPTGHARGTVWSRVGELISRESRDNPGVPVQVVYRDDNSMHARVARQKAKQLVLDLPHRVDAWITWRDTNNAMLTRVRTEAEALFPKRDGRQERVVRMSFPAVPGVRAALDRLVELVDGIRVARREDPTDFAACQAVIERLDAVYRELSTPWCDTCGSEITMQQHPVRFAHVTDSRLGGLPEAADLAMFGHEPTAQQWSAAT